MEIWHLWVILALILVVVEIFTPGFAFVCLAIGAGAAAVSAACDAATEWQLVWFAVATLLAFVLVRPLLLKYFRKSNVGRPSGVEALIGREGTVTERISNVDNTGRVAVDGDDWRAVTVDDSVVEKGAKVTVIEVNSTVLKVGARS